MKNLKIISLLILTQLFIFSNTYAQNNNMMNNTTSSTIQPTDTTIMSNVKSKIAADATISGLNVTVTSQGGVVSLVGQVNTDAEASKLIEIAESTPGVKDTDTAKLSVLKSDQPFTDMVITAKVRGTYIQEKLFSDKDISVTEINVETKNGIVYLSGTVDSQEKANNAVNLAKSISGVKSVESKIVVNPAVQQNMQTPTQQY